jgi:hypothetical protein
VSENRKVFGIKIVPVFYFNIERDIVLEEKKGRRGGGGGTEDVTIKNIFETKKWKVKEAGE